MFPDLDAAYQRQIETQTHVRRAVALVATSRKRLQLEIERLEREATPGARLTELRRQYAAIQAQEELVAVAYSRLQSEVNAFRDARKTIEAAYTAAEEAAEAVLAEATGAVPAECQNEAETGSIGR